MTNEEILLKLSGLKTSAYWEKEVLQAMEAARKDEAIAFADWRGTFCAKKANGKWVCICDGTKAAVYSTNAELYQIFKTQSNG